MSAFLKHRLKQILVNNRHRQYLREVEKREISYARWIKGEEEALKSLPFTEDTMECEGISFKHVCTETMPDTGPGEKWLGELLDGNGADILVFTLCPGKIGDITLPLLARAFGEEEKRILIYGDEDSLQSEERCRPRFKPDWSPDTFLSAFYFGGLVAVRREPLQRAYEAVRKEGTGEEKGPFFYCLLHRLLQQNRGFEPRDEASVLPVYHLREILFHRLEEGKEPEEWRLGHTGEDKGREGKRNTQNQRKPEVSIIIPSKDNPGVLFQCLDSLFSMTKTQYCYEIILVDNGSSRENRERIQKKADDLPQTRYLYEPMPFNFSKMCNLGAEQARAEVLLFLNDDMEIIQPDWLDLLMEKVQLPYVGAVGAKLLYPQSTIIQHAGITNLRVGPAHKLQFLDDEEEHYYGKNRGVHNMLAVTGACLMVRRPLFLQVGGFAPILRVAFNDVDLCYSLHEAGYYNVVRNDVVLYHHESLSRGRDGESVEKQLRLQREKDILYERHPKLYGKDPFYHPRLAADILKSEYCCAFDYQVDMNLPLSSMTRVTHKVKQAKEDQCLVVGMEWAIDVYKWRFGISYQKRGGEPGEEDKGYYFQGYSFVIGADNACYQRQLLLRSMDTGEVWGISLKRQYRPDIQKELTDQNNVGLTGFAVKIRRDDLKNGAYQFGILARDTCSTQKLVNWSNWVLEVTDEGVTQEERKGE